MQKPGVKLKEEKFLFPSALGAKPDSKLQHKAVVVISDVCILFFLHLYFYWTNIKTLSFFFAVCLLLFLLSSTVLVKVLCSVPVHAFPSSWF